MRTPSSVLYRYVRELEEMARERQDRMREEQEREDKYWHSVHDADAMNELLYEIATSNGGTEDLAQYLAAVMRAPKECHKRAIDDLRQMLLRWAARIDGEV